MHKFNMYVDIQKRKQNETCGQRKCWINKDRNNTKLSKIFNWFWASCPEKQIAVSIRLFLVFQSYI